MADSLRDQYLLRLRAAGITASPQALILCDLLEGWKHKIELSAGDANQTAANAYQFAKEAKHEVHKLKTKGESA